MFMLKKKTKLPKKTMKKPLKQQKEDKVYLDNQYYDDKENNKDKNGKNDFFTRGTLDLLDLIVPDCIEEGKDYIYLGPGKYLRVYAISGYPRNIYIGFLNDFFSIGGVDISTYIENIPDSEVIKRLTNKYSIFMSNIQLKLKRGDMIDYGIKRAAEDLDALREGIQTNTEKMFYAQPIIYIWAEDLPKLNDKCEMFDNICSRKSIIARCLTFEQSKGFLSGLPYQNISYNECLRNMTTGSIASLVPTGNTELSHDRGVYYGENLFTHSPILYDEFIGAPALTNPHMFVCGTSGAGKSVFLKLKASRSAASGKWVIILDPQEEYKKMIDNLGGQYITLQPGFKSGINPFELEIEEDEHGRKMIDLYGKRSQIIEMLSIFSEKFRGGKPLQGVEITAVDECIQKLYNDKGIDENPDNLYKEENNEVDGKFYVGKVKKELPVLTDLRNELVEYNKTCKSDNLQEFIEVMKMITGNGPMAIFDCQTTISLNSRIIAFSYKHLTDEFSKFFATVNSMSWIWSKFSNWRYKDIYKEVYVDEGSLFAKFTKSLDFIENIARLGRKFHISLTLATQFINDYLGNKSSEAIINLCATKVILKQESAVADMVTEFFHLSDRCSGLMSTFVSGQAILLSETDLVVMAIKPFDFEWDYVRT